MYDVVVVGSANLDLVVRVARHPMPGETLIATSYDEYPGGKGLNQAVAAARSGARVAFVAAVGRDDAGRRLVGVAVDEGIDITTVSGLDSVPTGRAIITVDGDGENSIVVVPGANHLLEVGDMPDTAVVLAQLEIPVSEVVTAFTKAHRLGATTVLNPAPAAPLPPELLGLTDVIVPNEHEIELIGGTAALLAAGVSAVVVTRGAAGADVVTSGSGTTVRHPAIRVEPVDTTAAGDAFCGALAARLAAGATLDLAVRWAVAAGGLATTRHGAVPSLPTAAEIEAAHTPPR